MNKDEQISEMANLMADTMSKNYGLRYKDFAEKIYNAGYRKVPDCAVILTPEERDEELKACNEKQAELEAEIERLKADNEALKMWNDAYTEENKKLKSKNIKLLQVIKDFAKKHCDMKCKIAQRRVEAFAEYLRYAGHICQGFDIIKQVGVREYLYSDEDLDEALKEFLE